MAESIAAEALKPFIEATAKSVGAAIKRQFNYLCCFNSNIATLKHEAEALENTAGDLQDRVNSARDNVQVITREVEAWLKESNDMKDLKKTILDEVPNVKSGCLKLGARFSLSKKAKKTADAMKKHRDLGKFDDRDISQPGASAAMQAVPLGNAFDFESRKKIEEDIMEILRDGEMNMIGICGMGGLGKTTMAKKIMNKALEKEHLFEEVVLAVVSQPIDKLKIQLEIGGQLDLKDLKDEPSEASRVQKLHARLTAGSKRILLVLDDVWETLKLEDLGIPRGCKGCTILLTSRNHDVLSKMDVKKENIFGMEVLTEEDSWFLFRETTGTCVDDAGLNSIAKDVVKECRGLPIAIITLGAALKDEKNMRIWRRAVKKMRKASPNPDFIKEVYNPLQISYDRLQSQEAKFVFLLCCLFGEDVDIPVEHLTCFCVGLDIFGGGISHLDEARDEMCDSIKMLKSRSLLLDGRNEEHVRMHDVVRDVCTFISKEKGYIDGNNCTWISSFQTTVGERAKLPANLRLLFLSGDSAILDDTFLEGIRELKVLSIENYRSLTSLPRTTESLRNLNTLILDSCEELETMSVVGKLVNLEILICRDCNSIDELPSEIKGLNHLKLLELTRCDRLQRMGPGIISSLVRLEELKMLGSFKNWGIQEGENVNAGLRELEALTNLTCLEIEIVNPAFVVEKRQLSSKLERFQISLIHAVADVEPSPALSEWEMEMKMQMEDRMHSFRDREMNEEWEGGRFDKKMSVRWWGAGKHFISDWLERTECLILKGINATNVDLAKTQNIRWLMMGKCETMKNIAIVCPFIERLKLYSLPELEEILDGPISSNSFHNLKELNLEDLPALKKLWKSNSSPVFHCLSSIRIFKCPKLEEILDGPISSNSFHNLKKLNLERLPSLKQLWKSSSLHRTNFVPVFSNLSSVVIFECPHLPNLGQLSISGVGCLPQLRTLRVLQCEMMKEVFLWDECDENKNDNEVRNRHITKSFPNLIEVELRGLPNLAIFCQGIEAIEFPLLTQMSIHGCPKMTSMVSSNENNLGATSNPDIDDDHSSHLFCQPQKMSFGSPKELRITRRNPFFGHKIPAVSFNGLEILQIRWFGDSMSLFSPSIARDLVSLKVLRIIKCDELVQVIEDDEEKKGVSGDGQRTILLFPRLQYLELLSLPKLVSVCEWKCDVSCRRVFIVWCSNLKIFNFGSNVSFSGLEELTIDSCHGSMSLFSSSIARNLVDLKTLDIYSCNEMVKVIEDEKEKENVVSGGAQSTMIILFPKLQELSLEDLPKLVSFCEWKCDVELPSLTKVKIKKCPNMEKFTLRSLITLKLETVKMDDDDFNAANGLNGALLQHLARVKEKQQKEMEEQRKRATEEGRVGEIEEEQDS